VTVAGHESRFDGWERGESRILQLAPYAGLGFSAVLTTLVVTFDPHPWPALGPTLGIAATAALWVLWLVTLHPTWADNRRIGAVYFVGLLVLAGALVLRSPWFGFFAWIGYVHAFRYLHGRWRYAGICATAGIAASAQLGGQLPRTVPLLVAWLVVAAFNAALAGAFSILGWRSEQQNQIRKQMVADLAEANGRLAATMQENAGLHIQLVTQAREAGVLDERQRMAREIHDTLAQGLIGIVAQLEAAGQAADRPPEWRRHLDTAARLARDSLSEARRSVQALRPEPLESARLADALAEVADRWSTISGVPAEVSTTGTARPMHPEIEVALLRTAQEALSNVAKHAAASRVGLTLSYMEELVTLDVRDDGVGFDPTRLPGPASALNGSVNGAVGAAADNGDAGGFGLTAMRQRVYRLAGQLEIESEPGAGTAISASVPAVPATAGEAAQPAASQHG
jgi:signal transduction histidine kinase